MAAKPIDKLEAVSAGVAEGFKTLRQGVFDGPLDKVTVELVVVGSLAATRQKGALRVHAKRLLEMGSSPEAIRQAIVSTLGASSTLTETVEALDVVEELFETQGAE